MVKQHDEAHAGIEAARGTQQVTRRQAIRPSRYLLALVVGVLVGILGTLVQRSGAAAGIPWGMFLAYILVALASWWVRNDAGTLGLSLHLVASTVVVWLLSMRGPGGDVLMPYADFPNFFAKYAVFLWMGGLVLIQFLALCLPGSLFDDGLIKEWPARGTAGAAGKDLKAGETSAASSTKESQA